MSLPTKDQELLINLTEYQAKFLKPIFLKGTATSLPSGLKGRWVGRVAGSTKGLGIVTPMGRKGRLTKWTLTPTWENNWNKFRIEITNILDKISSD